MKKTPRYTQEFREQAVELLISSNRPLKRVAEELGITANTLRQWRNRAIGKRRSTADTTKAVNLSDSAQAVAEIKRLKRENEYLRRQREILKKAMSILSEDPPLGMR